MGSPAPTAVHHSGTVLQLLLSLLFLLPWLCLAATGVDPTAATARRSTYIVHMAKPQMPPEFTEHRHWYDASLHSVSGGSAELLYTYTTAAHGFSARLTDKEADLMRGREGVLSVVPDEVYQLHTTRTPEFLGLGGSYYSSMPAAHANSIVPPGVSDVVVGVLDTGAWPGSKSYDDTGFGPIPKAWRGACEAGPGFDPARHCNRKLVGARFFSKGYEAALGRIDPSRESRSPRDEDGHGTHTSSTAAGSAVHGASLFGFAAGTARGMAPAARVAAYKVCWLAGCLSSDILAALDKAVDDGVHVLSLSLGGGQSDYFRDTIALGAFAAMEKGILVSCSAGNSGPTSGTLSNVAPWITTVGAGTLDRDFPAYVVLGNGKNYTGVSVYSGKPLPPNTTFPLIYAGKASNSTTGGNLCLSGTLIPEKVAGKIVLCDRGGNARAQKGYVVKQAGGAGMVLANTATNGEELVADSHLLPAANVGQKAGDAIRAYTLQSPRPTASIIVAGTKLGVKPSPVVAAFSSRGPNGITPDILKPDLIAPGVNILAGWSGDIGPTGLSVDKRLTEFNIVSGTSMSCPHVSGLAALVKGVHPGWSPAAIRSALMTTAYNSYPGAGAGGLIDVATGATATPFDLGAGHVDPLRALDPGLVYDLTPEDYMAFLCALNYTQLQIAAVSSRTDYRCDPKKRYAVADLNYPSFAVAFVTASSQGGSSGSGTTKKTSMTVRHTRTLTNVGEPATYRATVTVVPKDVKVVVEPTDLVFSRIGAKQSFTITFTATSQPSGTETFGRLEWSNGKHVVGSPMAFTWT